MAKLRVVASGSGDRLRVAEFFAGVGLARLGLEQAGCRVVWANDHAPKKKAMYLGQFEDGEDHYVLEDIRTITGERLPGQLAIAWASFPCTDLSLAGDRQGLLGEESGTFFEFVRILAEMGAGRPPVVVLENVHGLATSRGGDDLAAAVAALNGLGYSADVLSLDARRFVPQSRPRLFIVGAQAPPADEPVPGSELRPELVQPVFGNPSLVTHRAALPRPPAPLTAGLDRIVEEIADDDSRWWDIRETEKFLDSLSTIQRNRIADFQATGHAVHRTAYRRTRHGKATWEIRQDAIAGCLRTPGGGSSKQAVVSVKNGVVRVRWMTPLEYARLMGAGNYRLDGMTDNQARMGFGDAVCVPAVAWLAEHYLVPLAQGRLNGQMHGSSLRANGA